MIQDPLIQDPGFKRILDSTFNLPRDPGNFESCPTRQLRVPMDLGSKDENRRLTLWILDHRDKSYRWTLNSVLFTCKLPRSPGDLEVSSVIFPYILQIAYQIPHILQIVNVVNGLVFSLAFQKWVVKVNVESQYCARIQVQYEEARYALFAVNFRRLSFGHWKKIVKKDLKEAQNPKQGRYR